MNRQNLRSRPSRLLAAGLACLTLFVASAVAPALATEGGTIFNPISDPNWAADMFPIVVSGVSLGGSQPPLVHEPAVCLCPSHLFGYPVPGIGMSYWSPSYIVEVTTHPGKLLTLGGANVLGSAFRQEMGPAKSNAAGGANQGESRAQVHWYNYPLFAMLNIAVDMGGCTNMDTGFDLAMMTEPDPTWQNDLWSIIFSPEATLFANPIAQLACMVDATASTVAYPLDPMFWCAGAWGSLYPFSGNPNSEQSDQQANALTLAKFLARQFRIGVMWDTVGPAAYCTAVPSPVLVKSQFRVDPVYPHPVFGSPIYIGQSAIRWGLIPPANYPTGQDSAYLLWMAHQCCLRT